MFGFGSSLNKEALAAKEQAEKEARERSMAHCREQLERMRDVDPSEAERMHKLLKDYCGGDKRLTMDFKRKVLERAREYECNSNMRAADKILHNALRMAAGEMMTERSRLLSEGRKYFSKACGLGADSDFRHAGMRLIDTIMMTGGVQHKGPTRAKPLDTAPKTPNRAKA